MQTGIQSSINIQAGLDNLNQWYQQYLENKLKTEQTYNQDTFSGRVRGFLEAFNNPVGYFLIILLIVFIYKR